MNEELKTSTTNIIKANVAVLSNKDSERQRKWFDSGVRAKQRGYGDFSPFYENKTADYFFKCGYAGTSFEQAQETLRSEIEQTIKQDSIVVKTIKEIVEEIQHSNW